MGALASAEADADAYYGYGLGYSTLGYGLRAYGYGYPAYGYYGKRSADAEPEAMLTMDMVLDTALLDMVTDHTDTQLMDIMERDLLMLSQRPMLTTDMVLDTVPLDTVTDHMDTQLMVLMDVSGDKLYATQLRSSKANNQNQWRSVPKK